MTKEEQEALATKAELDRQDRELGPAVYIHMLEKAGYDEKCQEGSVEERFFFMVQAQLAELDLDEAKKYIERVNKNIS